MQFDKGDLVFLLSKRHTTTRIGTKCHIAANGVVFGVVINMFHGVVIEDGEYKMEVHGVTLLKTTLIFPNMKERSFTSTFERCERSIHPLERCESIK